MITNKDFNSDAPHLSSVIVKVNINELNHAGVSMPIPSDRVSRVFNITGRNFEETKEKTLEFIKEVEDVARKFERSDT